MDKNREATVVLLILSVSSREKKDDFPHERLRRLAEENFARAVEIDSRKRKQHGRCQKF